jgi:deoxyribodipyrimidine photo-lyase
VNHRQAAAGRRTTIVLLTRDLRVHDHPALADAARTSDHVVPLFVLDDALLASGYARPNRVQFLVDSLLDLDRALRALGGSLVIRRGDPVRETLAIAHATGARAVHLSADVSAFARRRERRLAAGCAERGIALRTFPGVTIVDPGALRPPGGDHFRVFTPYWHRWRAHPRRAPAPRPRRVSLPPDLIRGGIPEPSALAAGAPSPRVIRGGERRGRARLRAWARGGVTHYTERHDALDTEGTSRLSADLHFGCLSPLEVEAACPGGPGGEAFARQLCWRDFHHQVTAAFPAIAREDYRPRGQRWRDDAALLDAWKAGRTGSPLVDAGMRQLAAEGWMPNRARLVAAAYLVKTLGIDWRLGARHFLDLLVDGDIANNSGNWQWVAGTGNDTRPNRAFNPLRQAERFDPEGVYVRRWAPELA